MRFSTPKYCKTIICLIVFLSMAVGGYAQNSNAMQKAVFDGISLRDFSGATGEICNRLLLHNSGRTTIIFIQPIKLQLHPYSNIHSYNIKAEETVVCAVVVVPLLEEESPQAVMAAAIIARLIIKASFLFIFIQSFQRRGYESQ